MSIFWNNTPPPIELYWAYLVKARRSALQALARAKAQPDPGASAAELAALQATVDDCVARLKQLEPLRPMAGGHGWPEHLGDSDVDALTVAMSLTMPMATPRAKEPTP